MIEKGCNTCRCAEVGNSCRDCSYSKNYEDSRLYTAYLKMKAHAELARKRYEEERKRAERYKQALNCPTCGGKGYRISLEPYAGGATYSTKPCPGCAETRKEARRE